MSRGASKGEGLGNKFLANIRNTNAIIHVLRCFENDNITHVDGTVDPVRDKGIIDTELQLKDLETVESRIGKCQKQASAGDKTAKRQYDILVRYREALEQGLSARTVDLTAEERKAVADLNLLTDKPVLYVCNVDEKSASTGNAHTEAVRRAIEGENAEMLIVAAATEADIAELESYDERQMFLADMGLDESGVSRLIKAAYRLLDFADVLHHGCRREPRMDLPPRHEGSADGRHHPHRLRARLHSCRGNQVRRLRVSGLRARLPRRGQDRHRGQGVYGRGRRHHALPVQRITHTNTYSHENLLEISLCSRRGHSLGSNPRARAYTYRYRTAGTISVTGLGETEFASDLIVLRGSIDVENYDAAEAYRSIERDKRRVEEFLTSRGIAAESISFAMLSIEKNYQSIYNDKGSYQGQRFSGYAIRQHFTVESADIDTVEKVAMEISSLIADGISIDVYDPSYYYTKLDDLKLDLIGKAAADARSRAEELAENAGADIGDLALSRTGVFQITGANSDEEFSAGGSFNVSSRATRRHASRCAQSTK